jgi:tetratricopeptide (TPR) repeat protein
MSYIHEALNKAQKERDAHDGSYSEIAFGRRRKKGFVSRRPVLWISSVLVAIFLAFVFYSWLDSEGQQPPAISEQKYKMPTAVSRPKPIVDSKSYYDRGRIFHKKGRLKDAKRLYKETLRQDPGYVDALNNLAVIYMLEKNFFEAQKNLEKAIRLKPDNVDPYYNLACLYAMKGEAKKSLTHLRKAVSLDRSAIQWAQKDSDLNNVRGIAEFNDIIQK